MAMQAAKRANAGKLVACSVRGVFPLVLSSAVRSLSDFSPPPLLRALWYHRQRFGKCVFYLSCRGNTPETRGTAYVVYEDIFDAKNACDHLSGFNVCNRYLVVLYYNANRAFQKMDTKKKEEQLKLLKEKYGINTDPPK
ncbi:splicing factor 3B subunit 6 [Alexandromys fortis]|uniref:splicing factor 3B subunit 6 n=1 Tax=Alexandromys fortis TaxID=100897 RepID=UPI002152017D|nr:splicing factor 3B subunit 6 [Microtus fortis]